MANYNNLKTIIQAVINANGKQAITGDIMQQTLVAIVDALGKGYQFMGIATPATDPGTTDQKVFYIANGKGVYTNFGGLNVGEDGLVLLVYSETWTKLLVTNLADLADGSVTTPKIADSAVTENKLASQSVSSKKIKDATIGASKLGANSVTTSKIADKAVTFEKLDDNSVTTSKIEDGAVTTKKLQQWVIKQSDSTADIALWNEIKAFNPLTSKIPNIVFIRDNGFILPVQRIFTIATGEIYELQFFSFSPNEIFVEKVNPDDIYFNFIKVTIANFGEVSLNVSFESRPFSYIMDIKGNWLGGAVLKDESIEASKLQNGLVTTPKIADDAVTKEKIEDEAVSSPKLTKGARKPIILTPDTTEVDEETYQKLLSDDVDVVLKLDTGNLCLLTIKIERGDLLKLFFTCLSVEALKVKNVYLYGYKVSITKNSPHNCSATQYIGDTLYGLFELSNYLTKSALTPVPFTDTTLSNKAQLEVFLSKVPDATVMHCTYKEIWAGTLHKINGDWYGLLVKNTNNPADNINIKLSADGTITEGNSVQ